MALRRLAAAESPFRRLRVATFEPLKVAGKADGYPLSGARPMRLIAVADSTLSRVGGCDSALRRLAAAPVASWTRQEIKLLLDSPCSKRWLCSLPGGASNKTRGASSAGGGDKRGQAGGGDKQGQAGGGDNQGQAGGGGDKQGQAGGGDNQGQAGRGGDNQGQAGGGGDNQGQAGGGGDNQGQAGGGGGGDNQGQAGSASPGSGGGDKKTFDWDNFDWVKFIEYFKVAQLLHTAVKLCSYIAVGLGTVTSAVFLIVEYYVKKEVQKQVSLEREKRQDFEKMATLAHQEFVFRTNERYTNLQTQFHELREKNLELLQLAYETRNITVALMGQTSEQQNQDPSAK